MGAVTLTSTQNRKAFADFADSNTLFTFDPVSLEIVIPSVTQAALDTALINYAADQANIDAAFVQARADQSADRIRDTFDDEERRLLRAFAEVVLDELNNLRAQHGLAARTMAQLRTAIRNKIT